MQRSIWLLAPCVAFTAALALLPAAPVKDEVFNTRITWKKTVLDKTFRSEGVGVGDINKDGKIDVIHGEAWYEAPTWKMHAIQKLGDYGDGLKGYSRSFACWTEDLNGDGWLDVIVIDFPGLPCFWLENNKGGEGMWKKHIIWHSACNETPLYVDLFGTGKRVLLMGFQPKDKKPDGNEGQMAYFTPGKDPTQVWEMHPISEPSAPGKVIPGTARFSHGLGVGDVNADGKLDVICTGGWWEQPAKNDGKSWKFNPVALGDACADMYTHDIDGDGKVDILSSSAHKFGIWAHLQKPGKDGGAPSFVKQELFKDLVSETHAMHLVDINGDGNKDLVTGKRWWSHGRNEPGSDKSPAIYWFDGKKKDGIVTFTPQVIDDDSGIGTQFTVQDVNGDKLLDIVTSNKKGTFLIEQVRTKK